MSSQTTYAFFISRKSNFKENLKYLKNYLIVLLEKTTTKKAVFHPFLRNFEVTLKMIITKFLDFRRDQELFYWTHFILTDNLV